MIVVGIILIFGGLGGLISKSYAGGLAVLALGVVLLVLGIKRKKKKPQPVTQTQPQPQPQPVRQPQPAARPVQTGKTETIHVAGLNYRKEAVEALGIENDDYEMSKREIIDSGMEDEDIFEFDFPLRPASFRFEPENPHDPNAIAIDVAGEHIGYVKSGSTAHVRKLINEGKIAKATCEIYGGRRKRYNSEEETVEKETRNYGAKVTLTLKEE